MDPTDGRRRPRLRRASHVAQRRPGARPPMPDGAAGRPARSVAATLDAVRTRTASAVAAALATWSTGLVDDEAIAIERAADELVLVHRLPEATRALHHAAMIAARSDEGEARRLTKLAIERIDDLDAEQWRRQLIAELRAEGIGLRPRRRAKRASTGWASLTASEEAVVALVGEGLTNTDRRAALRVAAYRRVASRPGLPQARAHHPAAARRSGGPPNRPISPRHKRSACSTGPHGARSSTSNHSTSLRTWRRRVRRPK